MKSGFIYIALLTAGLSFLAFIYGPVTPITAIGGEMPATGQMIENNCTFDGLTPEVLATGETDTTEWHGRFELPDLPYIWEPGEPGIRILNFRKALIERLGNEMDSRELTERQRAIFAAMPDEWSGEAANSAMLLEGRAGTITDMSCLEMMLWNWQDARFPMLEHPTEFGAFVVRGHAQVRVYISSADLVGGKINREVTRQIQADILDGYQLVTHIHNHPFLFDRVVGDRMWTTDATINDIAGALAPSMSDVGLYRSFRENHGLKEAWITNGLQSSRFHAGEFDSLSAR